MQEQYIEPALKLIGGADELVLGSSGIGFDFIGERLPHSMEFETDDNPATPSR